MLRDETEKNFNKKELKTKKIAIKKIMTISDIK